MVPPYLTSHALSTLPGISHGFFGREGGVSSGDYKSLNAGPGSNDDAGAVRENRRRIALAMGLASELDLLSGYQTHSATALLVDRPFAQGERPECDALVTKTPGLGLCALAADCTPVLLVDPEAAIIASVHAGWKGALSGVIQSTLKLMEQEGGEVGRIKAAIGPCLTQSSFEVGPDLKAPFLEKHPWCESLFLQGTEDRSFFDIKRYCRGVLERAGVGGIDVLPEDTLSDAGRFHSNRFRVRNGYSDYGRNASVIALSQKV